jgi:hypothetical protein
MGGGLHRLPLILVPVRRARELFHSAGDNIEKEHAIDDAMYALHDLRSALKYRPYAENVFQDLAA